MSNTNGSSKDISILNKTGFGFGDIITTDTEKAINQYIIFLMTRTNSDVFFDAMSPLADIMGSNMSLDLDTFKFSFMVGHLKAVEYIQQNFPNIDIDVTDVIINEDEVNIYIEATDTVSGEKTQLVV